MIPATEQFRAAIRGAGIEPPEVIEADGKLRRFSSNGKRGDELEGWYRVDELQIAAKLTEYPEGTKPKPAGKTRAVRELRVV